MRVLKNEEGMSLIEVITAVFLFAIFITAFMTTQGNNITTSIRFKDELALKDIAEIQMQELILNPPEDFRLEVRTQSSFSLCPAVSSSSFCFSTAPSSH